MRAGGWMARLLRVVGWTLVSLGATVLLYVVYLLWFTGLEADRHQADLARQWQQTVEAQQQPEPSAGNGPSGQSPGQTEMLEHDDAVDEPDIPDDGAVYAALWFERDGQRLVTNNVLYVLDSVSVGALRRGPGHYPQTSPPGGNGNFAVAGHRTTYGSPFWSIDELADGDTIHVLDRDGNEWVYEYRRQQIVAPDDVWVLGRDPLGTGAATITLTTCHPRFSDAQRLVIFGELIGVSA